MTAVVALTLGIGVNVAVFTVVNAVLLAPLPFPDPERLVFGTHNLPSESLITRSAPVHYLHWREQTDVLEDTAAMRNLAFDFTGGDVPYPVTVSAVSEAYFHLLGAPFVAGRGFTVDEDLPAGGRRVVVSHAFWTERLGSESSIVGETLSLNGNAYTVVGITGPAFDVRDFGSPALWVPLQIDPATTSEGRNLELLARLAPGVTLEQAQARLAASMTAFLERYPSDAVDQGQLGVMPARDVIASKARPMLLMLAGAVALVLLLACANVANLLLVRATRRQTEIGIRAALGAGRSRLVRQLLTESLILAVTGGVLGLLAGFLGIRALLALDAEAVPRLAGGFLGFDWRVAGFALGLSLATGLLFGLVPALAGARADLNAVIRQSGGGAGGRRRPIDAGSLLVTAEVGLAVVLVIGAGLLIRTSLAIGTVDLGFALENVVATRTSLSAPRFATTAAVAATSDAGLGRIREIPGVESAAAAWDLLLEDSLFLPFDIEGRPNEGEFPFTGAGMAVPSSAGYLETMRIPLAAGRRYDTRDTAASEPVVMINRAMADQYWPDGRDPLGERIMLGGGVMPEASDEPWRRVVGIVGNVRRHGISGPPEPTLYLPLAQISDGLNAVIAEQVELAWLVRTAPGANVQGQLREVLRQVTGQPLSATRSLEAMWSRSIARQRLSTWLMNVFAATALLLAAVGVYGVVAYSAEQRRREIGIRMALGARATRIGGGIVRDGMRMVGVGIFAGLVGAYAVASVLASILFGVEPHDPTVFVVVPLLLAVVALIATAIPALRTSRLDPTVALRHH